MFKYQQKWTLLQASKMNSPKLLDQVRNRLRYKHYALTTERTYIHWIRRYIYFHNKTHPKYLDGASVARFLS